MYIPRPIRLAAHRSTVAIYTLTDPRDGTIRYVGKTTSPKDRYRQHLRTPGRATAAWIIDMARTGAKPQMDVVDRCGRWSWRRVERRWIRRTAAAGSPLLNIEHNPRRRTYRGAEGVSASAWIHPVSPVGRTLRRAAWAGLGVMAWAGAGGGMPDPVVVAAPASLVAYVSWSLQQIGRTP